MVNGKEPNATRQLAEYAAGLRYSDIPTEVIKMVKWLTLNILGCAAAGHSLESTQITTRPFIRMGGTPEATIIADKTRLPVPVAAALNGHAAYATMGDDTHYEGPMHSTHSVIMAALAEAEYQHSDGKEFLAASVAGFEVGCRVMAAMAVEPKTNAVGLGWRPSIVEPICACIPVAKILNLNSAQTTHALGIAATSMSGILESQTPTHVPGKAPMVWAWDTGRANYVGVLAAYLAKEGMTAATTMLEGQYGLVKLCTWGGASDKSYARLTEGLGKSWETMRVEFKTRCTTAAGQSAVDAAQRVVQGNGLKPQEIKRITIKAPRRLDFRWFRREFDDFNSSVYSIPYMIAVALLDGRDIQVTPDYIAYLDNPLAKEIMGKVVFELEKMGEGYPVEAEAVVETADGRHYSLRVEKPLGWFPDAPLSEDAIIDKFRRNMASAFSDARTEDILKKVQGLESLPDISSLAKLLQGK